MAQASPRRGLLIIFAIMGGLLALMASLWFFLPGYKTASDASKIFLALERVDSKGKPWQGHQALGDSDLVETNDCPIWRGGDGRSHPVQVRKKGGGEPVHHSCSVFGQWRLMRHETALSLEVYQGDRLWSDFFDHLSWDDFLAQAVVKSTTTSLREVFGIQVAALAEDDFKGYFLRSFFKWAIKNNGRLDFDPSHGRGGLVASVAQGPWDWMVGIFGRMAKRSYALGQGECEVHEFVIGVQTFYGASCLGRHFLGRSLTGLLNVMDGEGDLARPASHSKEGAAATEAVMGITFRPEAYARGLLKFLGKKDGQVFSYPVTMEIGIREHKLEPLALQLPDSPILSQLHQGLSPEAFLPIPHDVMAVMVVGLQLAPFESYDKLIALTQSAKLPLVPPLPSGPQASAASVAVLWDLNSAHKKAPSETGVIISQNKTSELASWMPFLSRLGHDKVRLCRQGRTALISRSPSLLTRMLESCKGGHPNLTSRLPTAAAGGLWLSWNFAVFLREMFLAGGGGAEFMDGLKETSPYYQRYREAKERMAYDALGFFQGLPVWGFQKISRNEDRWSLKGFRYKRKEL